MRLRSWGGIETDGWKLLTIPFRSSRRLNEALATAAVLEMDDCLVVGDFEGAERALAAGQEIAPQSWVLRNSHGALLLRQRKLAEARALFVALAAEPAPTPTLLLATRSNLALVDVALGDAANKDEADRLSAEAFAKCKQAPWAISTRGRVLLWLGRAAEALPLLKRGHALTGNLVERAGLACAVAVALAALHKHEEAERWLEQARITNPRCEVLPVAQRELERARGQLAQPAAAS
jgi:tetratricopeptide (TPR) repeat protein